ncbi:MAG: FHA domain-containing protein [Methylobacter sp.]|nr:FHA domain-containing protein [Methylobacter sp.]
MSFLANILQWLLPVTEQVTNSTEKPPEKPRPARKFDAIRSAVEDRLHYLIGVEIPEHREIAEKDVLHMYYVEIECEACGAELLTSFFKEFNPVARKDWLRGIIGLNGLVNLDYFSGVHSKADLPDVGTLDKHEQMLSQGSLPDYRVHIHGRWVQSLPVRDTQSADNNGFMLKLTIHDELGTRHEGVSRYPIKIGRGADCALQVSGRYSSRDHCRLSFDAGKIYLEDRSKYGTWLDGVRVPEKTSVELKGSRCLLKLGMREGEVSDYPEIEFEIERAAYSHSDTLTPIIQQADITPVISSKALMAVLVDASGNELCEVTKLPFSIGRIGCDYTTPPIHAGISGKHLSIESFTDSGAEVTHQASSKNGTALNDCLQPSSFNWPFGSEIALAPKWDKAPAMRITLKRAE